MNGADEGTHVRVVSFEYTESDLIYRQEQTEWSNGWLLGPSPRIEIARRISEK